MKAQITAGDILSNPTDWQDVEIHDSAVHPGRKIALNEEGGGFELTPEGSFKWATPDGAWGQFQIVGDKARFPETGRIALLVIYEP